LQQPGLVTDQERKLALGSNKLGHAFRSQLKLLLERGLQPDNEQHGQGGQRGQDQDAIGH